MKYFERVIVHSVGTFHHATLMPKTEHQDETSALNSLGTGPIYNINLILIILIIAYALVLRALPGFKCTKGKGTRAYTCIRGK